MTHYIKQQMETVCPLPLNGGQNGLIKLQIISERGRTNWLDISEDEFWQ